MFPVNDYLQYDALGLAQLVQQGDVQASELVETAIHCVEQLNPQLNAVIMKIYDEALTNAKQVNHEALFAGVPFLIKDIIASYKGLATTAGCRALQNMVFDHDSELISRYRKAGLITLGKTNLPEFGLSPVTESEFYGPCYNPWNLAHTPGGSSGGAAAAVAAGMVPLAHGSDGGGSIRIPASCCGLFGLKPSRGRTPMGPDYGKASQGFIVEHVLTRTVRDSAAMLDATCGNDLGAPFPLAKPSQSFLQSLEQAPKKLRIAFTVEPFFATNVAEECKQAVNDAVKLCQDLGHDVVEATPKIDTQALAQAMIIISAAETEAIVKNTERLTGKTINKHDIELTTRVLCKMARSYSASSYAQAVYDIDMITRQLAHFFTQYDVLITPTLANPPLKIGTLNPKPIEKFALNILNTVPVRKLVTQLFDLFSEKIFAFVPFTALFNASGQPAMSIPFATSESGLPIGVQFAAGYANEITLLQLAKQIETAKPWNSLAPISQTLTSRACSIE